MDTLKRRSVYATSAYTVVSAKPDILGVVERSITTAGGDLKGPDKHDATSSNNWKLPINVWEAGRW